MRAESGLPVGLWRPRVLSWAAPPSPAGSGPGPLCRVARATGGRPAFGRLPCPRVGSRAPVLSRCARAAQPQLGPWPSSCSLAAGPACPSSGRCRRPQTSPPSPAPGEPVCSPPPPRRPLRLRARRRGGGRGLGVSGRLPLSAPPVPGLPPGLGLLLPPWRPPPSETAEPREAEPPTAPASSPSVPKARGFCGRSVCPPKFGRVPPRPCLPSGPREDYFFGK